ADENALFPGAAAGHIKTAFLAHLYGAIEDIHIEDLGNKAGTDALEAVQALLAAADHRGFFRLHGVDLELGELLLKYLSATCDVATGTHPGDEVVDTLGKVGKDFLGRGVLVDLRVRRVGELHGHPAVGVVLEQLLSLFYATSHAQLLGGKHQLGPQGLHILAALDGHGFRHGEDQPVTLDGTHHGEGDAGVAGGGFD